MASGYVISHFLVLGRIVVVVVVVVVVAREMTRAK